MSPARSSIFTPPDGFWWTAVLAFCVAVAAPALAWFAGRGQAAAQLQRALNDAFRTLTEELQGERSALIARVSELEGQSRQQKQHIESLERLLERAGIEIPVTSYRRPLFELPKD